ncbi:MAG: MmgE/PrpD family protein [Ramlibacter sp.]|nr:MmgE/PrpD family protein [Ramlibacter sp.]
MSNSSSVQLTSSLSTFARQLRFEEVPALGVERVRNAIIDCIACMLAGTATEPARIAAEWAREEGGTPRATVPGFGFATSPTLAALVNGVSGHALDYDDVSPPMIGHPSVALVPALLAAAEVAESSGAELVTAYAIGLDAAARLGRLMNPEHYAHGWHATSTLGAVGAAVASGRLLGLDDAQMRNAIGMGASGAGGLRKNFGSMTKALHAGQAAQRGLSAAMLAKRGFDADPEILCGDHGFIDAFRGGRAQAADAASITFDTSQPLEIVASGVGLKQYACCGCTHIAIDVLLDLVKAQRFGSEDVERIECGVNPLAPGVLIHNRAATGFQGKFSMQYSVAVALLDGEAGPRQFEDERAQRGDVQAMQQRVSMHVDPDMPVQHGVFPTRVTVHLKDGRTLGGEAHKARGMHPDLPLSAEQVAAKFRQCAAQSAQKVDAERALGLLLRLEHLRSARELMSVFR